MVQFELHRLAHRTGVVSGRLRRAWQRRKTLRSDASADSYFRIGRELEGEGNLIGAAQRYREAIARDGTRSLWHYRLGRVLEATGDWHGARHAHRKAERLAPHMVPTLEGRRGKQLKQIRRIELALMRKPAYAYGLFRAATTARRLGVDRFTAVELGVAGGNGLLALEQHAYDIERMFEVKVDIFGLDTGEGLLEPQDERDVGYHFAKGNYAMDESALRERLTRASLVLGDAAETFPKLFSADIAPIGFVSFDMDHYTPTAAVLGLLGGEAPHAKFLPRTPLYFDDVVGKRGQDYNRFTGELLAIREFNDDNGRVKVDEDRYFRSLPLSFEWHHGCYTMHRFEHPDYEVYVNTSTPRSLQLKR